MSSSAAEYRIIAYLYKAHVIAMDCGVISQCLNRYFLIIWKEEQLHQFLFFQVRARSLREFLKACWDILLRKFLK